MKRILATIISVAISISALGIMNVQADEEMFNLPCGTGCYIETPEEFAANTGSNIDSGISIDSSRTSMAALPSMVDNSTEKFFPPIRTQGSVGSCTAWSTTYYQFTYEVNKFKNEPTTENNIYSPAWTFNYVNGGGQALSQTSYAYNVLNRQGAMKLVDFPCGTDAATYSYTEWSKDVGKMVDALEYRSTVYNVSASDSDNLYNIKSQLASGKVGVASTDSGGWVIKENSDGDKFIVCCKSGGGHAIAVVGYDDNISITVNGVTLTGAFKLANSWGDDWGNDGFIWVSYDAFNKESIYGTAWQNSTTSPLKDYKGNIYKSSNRITAFAKNNSFHFINIHHCPVTFAGCIEYTTQAPYDVSVYANEKSEYTNPVWDYPAGPIMSLHKRVIVFDYFQFVKDSNTGEWIYEGELYDMNKCLSSQWIVQMFDSSIPNAKRMRTGIVDNFGNFVKKYPDTYISFNNGKAERIIDINLAKGRLTSYDNNQITSEDVTMLMNFIAEKIELSNIQRYLADYNGNGRIDVVDVIAMNRDISAREGKTYNITDYIDEWGYSLADFIVEKYDISVEQFISENYAELSDMNVIPDSIY